MAEERLVYSIDTSAIERAVAQWKELEAVQERVARVTGSAAPGASSGGTSTGAIGSPIGGGPPITAASVGIPRLAGGAAPGALRQQFESLIEGRLAGLTSTIDDAERSVIQSLARQIAGSRLRRSPSDAGLDLLIQRGEAITDARGLRSADAALERATARGQAVDAAAASQLRLGAGAAATAADIDDFGTQAGAARRGVRGESQAAGRAFDDALRASTNVQRATERLEQITRAGDARAEAGRTSDLIRGGAADSTDERRRRRAAAADELRDFDRQVRQGEQQGRLAEGQATAADLSLPLRTRFEGISQARQAAGALNLSIAERSALAQQRTDLSADLREEGRLGRLDPISRGLAGAGFERFNNAAFQTGIAALTVQFGLLPLFGFNRAAQQQGQEFFGRTPEQAAATIDRDIALARVGRQGAPVQAAIERGQAAALQGVERFGLGGAIAGASAVGEFAAASLNLVSPLVGLAAAVSLNTAATQLNTAAQGGAGAGAAAGVGAAGAGGFLGGAGLLGGLAVAGATVGAGLGLAAVTGAGLAIQGGGRIDPALMERIANRPREQFDPRLPADLQGAGRFAETPQTGPTFADVFGGIGRTLGRVFGATPPPVVEGPPPQTPDQITEGRTRAGISALEADPDIQRRVREARIQANIQQREPEFAAAQRAQLDEAQQRQGLAQARFGLALAETQQAIGARRFDEDQAEERRQLGVGFGRQVRDIGIQRDRTLERIGINRERQQEDIDRGAGRQVEDIGRNLGRQVRDIGIGAGESREDVQRNLGRSLRDIDVQSGQAEEDINLGANRNVRDIFLGQIGGIGGALIRNAIGRQDALADLQRNRQRARARAGQGATDAGEDIGIGEGRAQAGAGRGAGDALQDVGIGRGRATEDADIGAGRAIEDANRAFGQAVSDAAKNFGDATDDLSRAQTRARERFEEDQRLQGVLLERQRQAIEQQTRLIENGTTNITGWLTIVTDFTKAMADAERVIKNFPSSARRALQEGAAT